MRLVALGLLALAFAGRASAATPHFGLFDLGTGLAQASHNVYGDVRVSTSRSALARRAHGATLVRCAADCRLGRGWLAFAKKPLLTGAVLAGPVRAHPGRNGWSVSVALTPAGRSAWLRVAAAGRRYAARAGIQPVYAVVLNGTIAAVVYGNDLRLAGATLELAGFTKQAARTVDKSLS